MNCARTGQLAVVIALGLLAQGCSSYDESYTPEEAYPAVKATFGANLDLENLAEYAGQTVPAYITKNNQTQVLDNAKATLGRVLFYDKQLSTDNTVACATCHQQALAFSDDDLASLGVNGTTGRHSMRLVNARFAQEVKFFWDERAASLSAQTTQPIQDHNEMGFSGDNGDPSLADLLGKLGGIEYYQELFTYTYGDATITEARLQECLSQFVASIQSFDSKYDAGRAQVANDAANFPNFTAQENEGKTLFLTPPQFNGQGVRIAGGAGCQGCHRAPEFDIDPNTLNNGFIGAIGGGTDITVTRSPSLRDLMAPSGSANGPFMHTGFSSELLPIVNHYNRIPAASDNANLDPRLKPGGNLQDLALTDSQKDALVAFLLTLTGSNVYTDAKWANPFLDN